MTGLTAADAAARLRRDGPNRLSPPPGPPTWRRLAAEFTHFFALMLWVAGALALVAGMPQLGIAIFVVIVVNGLFAFAQEGRAEAAAARLRDLLPAKVVVVRDGQPQPVDAVDIVVGDLVVLAPGDRVPADLVMVTADDLSVDMSTLTGESVPVAVGAGDAAYAGTYVTTGAATGTVEHVGEHTRLAGIAQLTATVAHPRSPLAHEIDRIVRVVAAMAVGVGLAFFGLSMLLGSPARDGLLFAIGVTVALVPEGLLPTMTLSLAMGAQRMAQRDALVRHLEAVETLGATTFICTDKTGTLTRNQMSVVTAWTPAGTVAVRGSGYEPTGAIDGAASAVAAATELSVIALSASQGRVAEGERGWAAVGDPMEAAIDAFARRCAGSPAPVDLAPPIRRYAFDPGRRRESVVVGPELFVKGAPDAVIDRCADTDASAARAALDDMTSAGLRALAVARRRADGLDDAVDADTAEQQLELVGLLGLHDPPRETVADAIAAARSAGVRLAMVTGDHPATARAIGRQIGFFAGAERVLEGRDLPEDPAMLGALLDHDGVVVGRVTPEDKLRIAEALQARGHVVAMTGDGANDGPALQQADVGVAMGRGGTDVARAAADLVLLDDDFATIVAAVEQGRATFTNIRRFLTYHLTDNVAELTPFVVWALSGGRFPLALGVLQILCLDIGTDLLPALALGNEPPSEGLLHRPPEGRHLIDRPLLTRVFGVLGPTEALLEMTAFVVALVVAGWRPGDAFPTGHALLAASGAAFAAVVCGQVGNAYACRSATRPVGRTGWASNRSLNLAVLVELAALAGFLWVPPVARLLTQASPPFAGFVVAMLAAPVVLAADRVHKLVRARRRRPVVGGASAVA
ncbi:MAG: cation-transporting P-type ATPase [Acidimicrobiales bacterium]